ncbi:MAG: hypothetical protein GY819_18720 [Planctomycetaceae bacterium]|nr:hypothetical protein [Planctomycetaceae bacterium]MDG1808951.1 hypothetical protein [Pirellulaceae bacterium]MDG2102947.1 hypothetical protein [Pirellulaceae bacterium]
MVNPDTWSQLGDDGQREFNSLLRRFQNSLRSHGVRDGYDLGTDWRVTEMDGSFVISNGDVILEGIASSRRDVIDALYADGVVNLNR